MIYNVKDQYVGLHWLATDLPWYRAQMLSALIAPCLAAGTQTDVQQHQAPGPWREPEICLYLLFCHKYQL